MDIQRSQFEAASKFVRALAAGDLPGAESLLDGPVSCRISPFPAEMLSPAQVGRRLDPLQIADVIDVKYDQAQHDYSFVRVWVQANYGDNKIGKVEYIFIFESDTAKISSIEGSLVAVAE